VDFTKHKIDIFKSQKGMPKETIQRTYVDNIAKERVKDEKIFFRKKQKFYLRKQMQSFHVNLKEADKDDINPKVKKHLIRAKETSNNRSIETKIHAKMRQEWHTSNVIQLIQDDREKDLKAKQILEEAEQHKVLLKKLREKMVSL
jgi:hypothetical protein